MKILRFYTLLIALFAVLSSLSVQAQPDDDVTIQLQPADALPHGWLISPGLTLVAFNTPTVYNSQLIPLSLFVEKGLNEYLAVGGFVGYRNFEVSGGGISRQDEWRIGARATGFVFPLIDRLFDKQITVNRLEPYIALMLGIDNTVVKVFEEKQSGTDPFFGLLAGSRYYFNEQIAVFGELGYGTFGLLTIGLTVHLGKNRP